MSCCRCAPTRTSCARATGCASSPSRRVCGSSTRRSSSPPCRELARNTVIHGGGGHMTRRAARGAAAATGVWATFEDDGPGIPDIAAGAHATASAPARASASASAAPDAWSTSSMSASDRTGGTDRARGHMALIAPVRLRVDDPSGVAPVAPRRRAAGRRPRLRRAARAARRRSSSPSSPRTSSATPAAARSSCASAAASRADDRRDRLRPRAGHLEPRARPARTGTRPAAGPATASARSAACRRRWTCRPRAEQGAVVLARLGRRAGDPGRRRAGAGRWRARRPAATRGAHVADGERDHDPARRRPRPRRRRGAGRPTPPSRELRAGLDPTRAARAHARRAAADARRRRRRRARRTGAPARSQFAGIGNIAASIVDGRRHAVAGVDARHPRPPAAADPRVRLRAPARRRCSSCTPTGCRSGWDLTELPGRAAPRPARDRLAADPRLRARPRRRQRRRGRSAESRA